MEDKKKGAIQWDLAAWIAIGLGILLIMLIAYFFLKDSGSSAVEFIKNLFRLGR